MLAPLHPIHTKSNKKIHKMGRESIVMFQVMGICLIFYLFILGKLFFGMFSILILKCNCHRKYINTINKSLLKYMHIFENNNSAL